MCVRRGRASGHCQLTTRVDTVFPRLNYLYGFICTDFFPEITWAGTYFGMPPILVSIHNVQLSICFWISSRTSIARRLKWCTCLCINYSTRAGSLKRPRHELLCTNDVAYLHNFIFQDSWCKQLTVITPGRYVIFLQTEVTLTLKGEIFT